jgi:acyl-CoA reductase-like NAD-dependent aldehyde dehydrogenase
MSMIETRRIRKLNPATGLPLRDYPVASTAEVGDAVAKSRRTFADFRKTSLKTRARLLKTISELLYRRADSIAAIISEETGKPISDSLEADIGTALALLHYYAQIGPKTLKPRIISPDLTSQITGRLHRETFHPRGTIAIISPWNYPLAIPASGIAAALMTGNTTILKPSELTPATGIALVEMIREALSNLNLPMDTVQVLIGDGQTGAELITENIDGVIFTGSDRTGRKIRETIGGRGLWNSLELGGSDAMIVLDGCDLEKAASYAVWGRFVNAGQACASVKRLLVPARSVETILKHLEHKMSRLCVGPPSDTSCHVGPLISETQLNLLEAQVRDAVEQGARMITGGQRLDMPGWFYAPTLLANVSNSARMLHEEVFGPALPVIPYQHVDDAIALANDSGFGLTTSLFGPGNEAKLLAERLECGTVVINDVGPSNYAMVSAPWGGWKNSGAGVSHGTRSLLELSRSQVVSENLCFSLPWFNKPFWQFGPDTTQVPARSQAVLAVSGRQCAMWHPKTWLAFWNHRASKKL